MKISKVGHTSMAIGLEEHSTKGMLFNTPNADKNNQTTADRIKKLVEKAQALYNPFNASAMYDKKEEPDKSKVERDLVGLAKELTRKWAGKYVKNPIDTYQLKFAIEQLPGDSFEFVYSLCRKRLKKAYSGNYEHGGMIHNLPAVFAKYLVDELGMENLAPADIITEKEKAALRARFEVDYYKEAQIIQLADSIEKNDVKVQVQNGLLVPAFMFDAVKGKKIKFDKKYIFDFLKRYVSGDDSEKKALTTWIKALLVLFVCGDEAGEIGFQEARCQKLDMWSWGKLLPEDSVLLNDRLFELCQERESLNAIIHTLEDRINAAKSRLDKDRLKGEKNRNMKDLNKCRLSIRSIVDDVLKEHFQSAVRVMQAEDTMSEHERNVGYIWLQYFQQRLKECLSKLDVFTAKLGAAYLCHRIYGEWTSYIAMKFVELGKAVYHFAMPENPYSLGMEAEFGKLREEYACGITSFDYERITAEEKLKRNLAVAVTYAAAAFSNCVVSMEKRRELTEELKTDMSDVLQYDLGKNPQEDGILCREDVVRPDAKRRILQFFGGNSAWEASDRIVAICEAQDLVYPIKNAINIIRNYAYHYGPRPGQITGRDMDTLKEFFQEEYSNLTRIYVSKYYSNNTPQFYPKDKLIRLFNYLYQRESLHVAQVPAFANVLPRKEAVKLMLDEMAPGAKKKMDDKEKQKFHSSLYFVLKEIYYNGFLQEPDLKDKFMKAMDTYQPGEDDNQDAFKNFKERIDALSWMDFGAICQQIMTDVNMQNQGQKAVRTNKQIQRVKAKGKKDAYQHFKLLLLKFIREAFANYVKREKNDIFGFLKNVVSYNPATRCKDKPSLEGFLDGRWQANNFASLKDGIEGNDMVLAWYITAHFIPPKQLNLLRGDIREYQQYLHNINLRAKASGNREKAVQDEVISLYNTMLQSLDFVNMFNGVISHEFLDYFDGQKDYWEYLNKFLDFDINEFPDEAIFFDGQRPILQRGIVFSVMYGMEHILSNIGYHVSKNDYQTYRKLKEQTAKMLANGKCANMVEQKAVNRYQQLKRRLSMHDLLDLSQMIMDHLGQLVSYAYIRERDLMYFQLGISYVRLNYSDSIPADSYWRSFTTKEAGIRSGAILYDIISMYTPDLRMYGFGAKGSTEIVPITKGSSKSPGAGVGIFLRGYPADGMATFMNGMDFFIRNAVYAADKKEDCFDHMVAVRKSIDHMKYLAGEGRSILDYYSEMYNGFFQYNVSLKKSVSYIINNIMMRYFLSPSLYFRECCDDDKPKGYREITITSLKSEVFTYKNMPLKSEDSKKYNNSKEKAEDNARSREFIDCAKALMELRVQ